MLTAAALIAFFIAVIVGCVALLVATMPSVDFFTMLASYIDAFFFYVSKSMAIVRLFLPMEYFMLLISAAISLFAIYMSWQGITMVIRFIRTGSVK